MLQFQKRGSILLGTIVNVVAILLGGSIGLFIGGRFKERFIITLNQGLALCVCYIGISQVLSGDDTMLLVVSIALGAILGELIDLDGKLEQLGGFLENRFSKKDAGTSHFAEGFVTSTLLFCIGAMAIVGSLQSGLTNNHEILFTKALIDGVSAMVFASTLGMGVLFSSVPVFLYQGSITLLAISLSNFFTPPLITSLTAVGGLLVLGLGLNMLKVTHIRTANLLPALIVAPVYLSLVNLI